MSQQAANWRRKILKQDIDGLEQSLAQAFVDLEKNVDPSQRAEVRDLTFHSATEADIGAGKKVVIIVVPYVLLNNYRRLHHVLSTNFEKKLSGKHVIFIGQRRILPKESRNNRVKRQCRPRSRTLTAVHEAVLEDVCYPTEIVGKRIRYKVDGSKVMKVYLNPKDQQSAEGRLETYSAAYRKLTGKSCVFEFPPN
mmetsp:Transcript_22833/g.35524  ORF Transcript_22833/g.35524 Transcript_22833/m.35524 type:complete len:195 (-) Transcript_22833:186-770(-)|eukprot:CAMPEP_0201506236 /NCGR_PEP_ID=MMETSP0161_2-20130828/168_1 /ASSEMBLY_ACC=CAM_ASM_000251 /TAXON_ID=180227 /ORGANISM="Neoparamoeba aestuarina, Strain SoJaBio B1-5/56/2" /LENGTH=194 /DNA_ID=CAMNT_0047900273 /DNA_START=55 /DNA_END=639 /DNA_ORIENTATION=-